MAEALIRALRGAVAEIPFDWLRERRWFSSKGQTLESLGVADWGVLPLEQPAIMALVVARYARGGEQQYLLPLIASREPQAGAQVPAATTFTDSGTTWYVHDAFQFSGFQRLLMELLIGGGELPLQRGRMVFAPSHALRQSPPPLEQIRLVAAEQSNTSVIYDRKAILKCFRRVVAGLNPDVEVSAFLTMRAGFRHTPGSLGSIAYFDEKNVEHSVGLLQEFVPNQGDAWDHTLGKLAEFLFAARQAGAAPNNVPAETQRLAQSQLAEMQQLGMLTAELHLSLASDEQDPAFAPRPLLPEHIAQWQLSIRRQSEAILDDLALRAGGLPTQQQQAVQALLAARACIERRIVDLSALLHSDLELTRFHGDYHLGQVLVTDHGFLILDFEGEPMRSLDERRAHSSPLKDVAGMLRSLSYAGYSALLAADAVDADAVDSDAANRNGMAVHGAAPSDNPAPSDWVSAWEQNARDRFLNGYLQAAGGARFLPQEDETLHCAIAVFELEKALYELKYELNNRPGWLLIPLQGILRTIEARCSGGR